MGPDWTRNQERLCWRGPAAKDIKPCNFDSAYKRTAFGKELKGSGCGLIQVLPSIWLEEFRNIKKL
jgi:hypothetical protein